MSTKAPPAPVLLGTLGLSVIAISAAAPLILAAHAPAAVTSLWRMLGAGLCLIVWAAIRERAAFARLSRGDLFALFVSGNLLALHYLFWIGSLGMTSVVSSTVLVTTNPLWVGLGAWAFLREPPSKRTWVAIAFGIAGAILLGLADAKDSAGQADSLLGDAMAIGAALAGSGTMLYGRSLRARLPTSVYQAFVCLGAVPLVIVAILGTHAPAAPTDFTQVILLASIMILPQLIGNTILSWALGFLTAPRVALVILGEPIGASVLAWIFNGQAPKLIALPGSILVLFAVVLGMKTPEKVAAEIVTPGETAAG